MDWLLTQLGQLDWGLTWWTILSWGGALVGLAHVPSVLLQRETRPMAALAWTLCLLTLPLVGVVLWWLIGRARIERRQREWSASHRDIEKRLMGVSEDIGMPETVVRERVEAADAEGIPRQAMFLGEEEGVFPTTSDNDVTVFVGGNDAYNALEAAVRAAEHHIHFEFYIWQRDDIGRRFRDLLVEKAREGVEVRVLFDAVGVAPGRRFFMKPLVQAGGRVAPFLPVNVFERRLRVNFRNHRKIVVVDGRVGFTGGMNIGQEYTEWQDVGFRFDGPVVYQLQEIFADDWYYATDEVIDDPRYFQGASTGEKNERSPDAVDVIARVVASGPDRPESVIRTMFFLAMTSARERIWLTTPYFVPDQAVLTAIRTAAQRGVDVRILVPGVSDVPIAQAAGRSYFDELLEVGASIYEYQGEVLHAKTLLFDTDWVLVGSANLDIRSFLLNFEANCVLHSADLNARLASLFEKWQDESRQITRDEYAQRRVVRRLAESTARLLSPLL
ncbi:MAG: cardiolipin synthase [Myxococcota bacterium]